MTKRTIKQLMISPSHQLVFGATNQSTPGLSVTPTDTLDMNDTAPFVWPIGALLTLALPFKIDHSHYYLHHKKKRNRIKWARK